MQRRIALTGHKGCGKDTAALGLMRLGYENLKFAAGMKDMLHNLVQMQGCPRDWSDRMFEGDLKEVPSAYLNGKTPRHALETLGTEWGRNCMGANIWVEIALNQMKSHPKVVVSDLRFFGEFDGLQAQKFFIVRIEREGCRPTSSHQSQMEMDLIKADLTVINEQAGPEEFRLAFMESLRREGVI
jgi:hypothetical protein